MKILFLTHKFYPDIGGIEVNSEILAREFHKAGHDIKLITWTKNSGEKKFPFIIVRNPGIGTLLREHRWADVVFENNPSLRLAWPSYFFNKPSVIALRTWINRVNGKIGWQDKLKALWLKKASAVIAVSDAIRKKCWPSAIVIGNPYRNELFRIVPGVEKTNDFVFLGRLVSDKGADIALRALSKLIEISKKESEFSLTIIGNGPELSTLKNMVITLNLQNNVQFKGSLTGKDLVNCLNSHNIILVPSIWEEPFGNVALEGMACGCIPIVSDRGGLTDAIGKAGLSFRS